MENLQSEGKATVKQSGCTLSRRKFLFYSGTAITTGTVMLQIPGVLQAKEARIATYPQKLIAKMSDLKLDQPLVLTTRMTVIIPPVFCSRWGRKPEEELGNSGMW